MGFNFTPAQRAAVETTDRSIVLAAGAGSGKTRVLVEHFLFILKNRLATVEEILAITFTNKAAGEMKERIMHEVVKEALRASAPEEKEFWRNIKEDMNRAQICTFHSFCGQVLRDNPLETQVDPFFTVLEEREANELLADCVEEILLTGLDQGQRDLIQVVREFGIYPINDLLTATYLNSRGHNLQEIASRTLQELATGQRHLAELKEEIAALVDELININHTEKLAAGTKSKLDELEVLWPELSKEIADIQSLRDVLRKSLSKVREILKGNMAKSVSGQIKRIWEIVDTDITATLADIRAAEIVPALVQVLQAIDERYRGKKRSLNGLDFEDLQEMTLHILRTNREFSQYYQWRFKFIMVDEFQDTNPVQEELIRLLIGGAANAPLEGNRLFIVGDPKQSIYRFRGADVTVFKRVAEEIRAQGVEITLDVNFRSREKIIEFVNHGFAQIFGTGENSYDMPYQPLRWTRRGGDADVAVELLLLNPAELADRGLDGREEEAVQLARRILEMVQNSEALVYERGIDGVECARAVRYGDVAILFQALTNVQIYEEALQKYGIPYTVVNGRGFFERQEVQDVLNLLKVIDNHHREIEWAGVLRSPFAGLSDEDLYWLVSSGQRISQAVETPTGVKGLNATAVARLTKFLGIVEEARAQRERIAISSLITQLLAKTGYLQLLMAQPFGRLERANIEKLIAMARAYEEDTFSSLNGFIRYIERLRDTEAREGMAQVPGEGEFVKLMSIHQSKGLEFPVVILPDSQRPLLNTAFSPAVFFDVELGIGMRVRDPLNGGGVKTSIYARIMEEEKLREIAERKRLFYVAATRAKDYLLLSGQIKEFAQEGIDKARHWLDWLGQVFGLTTFLELPDILTYGQDNGHIISLAHHYREITGNAATASHSIPGIERWQEIYASASVQPIVPRGKTGYYEFGVSSLLTYEKCPRWYYHQYIQRMPDNLLNPLAIDVEKLSTQSREDELEALLSGLVVLTDEELETGLALSREGGRATGVSNSLELSGRERGTLIHLICQKIQTLDDLPRLVKYSVSTLRTGLTQEQIECLTEKVRPYAAAFLRKEADIQARLYAQFPTGVRDLREFSFNLILGEALIRGTIDRVLITPEEIILIDYKSNRIDAQDIAHTAEKYRLQMEVYALAVQRLFGVARVSCKLHFLFPDAYSEEVEFGPTDFLTIEQKLLQLTSAITYAAGQIAGGGALDEAFPVVRSGEHANSRKDSAHEILPGVSAGATEPAHEALNRVSADLVRESDTGLAVGGYASCAQYWICPYRSLC